MDHKYLKEFLEDIRTGRVTDDEAMEVLTKLPYKEMEFANIDNHRALRTGYPEAILSEGKTPEQVAEIMEYMKGSTRNVIATRASREVYEEVLKVDTEAVYFETARIILSNGDTHK